MNRRQEKRSSKFFVGFISGILFTVVIAVASIYILIQNPKKIMGAYVKPGDVVVDLGCGGGFFSVALAEMVGENGRVIAADLQKEMLDITRNFAAKKHVLERITLRVQYPWFFLLFCQVLEKLCILESERHQPQPTCR